jgi:hypothetical protein
MNRYWINYLMLSGGNVCNIPCTDSLDWKEVTKAVNKIRQREDAVAVFVYNDEHKPVHHEILVDFCGQKMPYKPFVMAEPGSDKIVVQCTQTYVENDNEYWTKGHCYEAEYLSDEEYTYAIETNFGSVRKIRTRYTLENFDEYFKIVEG